MQVKHMIEEFYARDADSADAEIQNQPISLRIAVTHLLMLQVLADRFGQTRASVGGDFLEAAIDEAFAHLSPLDQAELSKKADQAYREYCTKKYDTFEMTGGGHWSAMAWAYQNQDAAEKKEGGE